MWHDVSQWILTCMGDHGVYVGTKYAVGMLMKPYNYDGEFSTIQ